MLTPSPRSLLALIVLCGLCCTRPAHAYVDPGTGSFIWQTVLAGLFSALFTIKLFWTNIKLFVKRRMGGKQAGDARHVDDATTEDD